MAVPPRFEHYPNLASPYGPYLKEQAPDLRLERLGDWYHNIVHFDLDPQNSMLVFFLFYPISLYQPSILNMTYGPKAEQIFLL